MTGNRPPPQTAAAWAVLRHELRRLFLSAPAWLFLAATLALAGLFFSISLQSHGEASLRPVLPNWVALWMFSLPLLTMGTLAGERRAGTLELLLSAPISGRAIVAGKWLAVLILCLIWLALTLPCVFVLWRFGDPDPGLVFTTYLGLGLCGALFCAAGIFVSACSADQMTAGVGTVLLLLPTWLAEPLASSAPPWLAPLLQPLALTARLRPFSQGLLDADAGIWFVFSTFSFLILAAVALRLQRAPSRRAWGLGWAQALGGLGLVGALLLLIPPSGVSRDLSRDGASTLRPQTLEALRPLLGEDPPEVEILAFAAKPGEPDAWARDRQVRDLLERLQRAAPALQTALFDLDVDRGRAEALGVRAYGTVVVRAAARRVDLAHRELFWVSGPGAEREVRFTGEAALGRALRQVLSEDAPRVMALVGHGERRLLERGRGELRALHGQLREQGWEIESVDLLRNPGQPVGVPEEIHAVFLLGPRGPLAPVEERALAAVLQRGGGVALFLEADGAVPELLGALGIAVPEGVALDPVFVPPDPYLSVLRLGDHPITAPLRAEGRPVVAQGAVPIRWTPRSDVQVVPLLQTSDQGWIERGEGWPPRFDPPQDLPGPVPVAVAVRPIPPHPLAPGRLLVVGDAAVVGDALMGQGAGNATFALNSLRWVVHEEAPMGQAQAAAPLARVGLSVAQRERVRGLLVGALPLLLVGLGAALRGIRRWT